MASASGDVSMVYNVGSFIMKQLAPLGFFPGKVPIRITRMIPGNECSGVKNCRVSLRPPTGLGHGIVGITCVVHSAEFPFVGGVLTAATEPAARQKAIALFGRLAGLLRTIGIDVVEVSEEASSKASLPIECGDDMGRIGFVKWKENHPNGFVVGFELWCRLIGKLNEMEVHPFVVAPVQVEWKCQQDCCKVLKLKVLTNGAIRVGMFTDHQDLDSKAPICVQCNGEHGKFVMKRGGEEKHKMPSDISERQLVVMIRKLGQND